MNKKGFLNSRINIFNSINYWDNKIFCSFPANTKVLYPTLLAVETKVMLTNILTNLNVFSIHKLLAGIKKICKWTSFLFLFR